MNWKCIESAEEFPADKEDNELVALYAQLLSQIEGEDPQREGLLKTPRRAASALRFLTRGYGQDPVELLTQAVFEEKEFQDMVIVKDVEFYSRCEHHLLPFYGHCHVAYIPTGRIVGLSKIPRLVEVYARRFQVQERLTRQIGQVLNDVLKPRGVAVVMEARHLCMMIRGVEKQHSKTITSALFGEFHDDRATRAELMNLLQIQSV